MTLSKPLSDGSFTSFNIQVQKLDDKGNVYGNIYSLPIDYNGKQGYDNLKIDAFEGNTLELHPEIPLFSDLLVNSKNKKLKINGESITYGFAFNEILSNDTSYNIAVIGNHYDVKSMYRNVENKNKDVKLNSETYKIEDFMQDRADIFSANVLEKLDNKERISMMGASDVRNVWKNENDNLKPGKNIQGISIIIIPRGTINNPIRLPKFREK